MNQKNQRNPRRRLNSLILLVAFTAVMLIISTYAWFSSQKNVTISNLEGKVNVAEGLMVSLDAKSWSQEVDFEDYDQTSEGVAQYTTNASGESLANMYADTDNGLYIRNNIPSELIPVSTTGKEYSAWGISSDKTTGTGSQEIDFYAGVNVEGTELYNIAKSDLNEGTSTEVDFPGYFAIDLFLQNSSKINPGDDGVANTNDTGEEKQGEAKETLQLNTNSLLQLVTGGSDLTGLQNTVRVALAMYTPGNGASKTSSDESVTASVFVTADQVQILNAYKNATISDVAIWEPNATSHVDTIVTTNNKIKLTRGSKVDTLYVAEPITGSDGDVDIAKFTASEVLPTYALTSSALTASEVLTDSTRTGIKDVYNWATASTDVNSIVSTNNGLTRQIALQTSKSSTDYTTVSKGVRNLISNTSSGEAIYEMGDSSTETGAIEFQMLKNTVVKCRLYVWLEGQDPDCINHASHGTGVHLDLGLVKGQEVGYGAAS